MSRLIDMTDAIQWEIVFIYYFVTQYPHMHTHCWRTPYLHVFQAAAPSDSQKMASLFAYINHIFGTIPIEIYIWRGKTFDYTHTHTYIDASFRSQLDVLHATFHHWSALNWAVVHNACSLSSTWACDTGWWIDCAPVSYKSISNFLRKGEILKCQIPPSFYPFNRQVKCMKIKIKWSRNRC